MAKSIQQRCSNCKKKDIVQCDGCIHRFCATHFSDHRRQLDDLFEQVFNEQKVLLDKITDPYTLSDVIYPEMNKMINEINQWEFKTLKIVKNTAAFARQQVKELIIPDNKVAEDELDNISKELQRRKEDCDYFEQDIERLSKKLKQIEMSINVNPPQLRIQTNSIDWSKVVRVVLETPKCNNSDNQQQFFFGGTLIQSAHQVQLNQFYGNQNQKWRLIYKATRDGFTFNDFHRCCDEKGPTLTIIQSTNEYLFGGYTSVNWNKKIKGWAIDKTAFLFTLINPHDIPPTKYTINDNGKDAVFSSGNGPAFGSVDINVNSNSNRNIQNYIMFPRSYKDTTGKGNLTFTSSETFLTTDIEIYRLFSTQENQ